MKLSEFFKKAASMIVFDDTNTNIKADDIQEFCEDSDSELVGLDNRVTTTESGIATKADVSYVDYKDSVLSDRIATTESGIATKADVSYVGYQDSLLDNRITLTESGINRLQTEKADLSYVNEQDISLDTRLTAAENTLSNKADVFVLNNDYYSKSEYLTTSSGSGDAGKPVVLNNLGYIDSSMLDITAFEYIDSWNPSDGTEYPDTIGHNGGAFWIVQGVSGDYTFTGGDLSGITTNDGDFMVWNGSEWTHINHDVDPNAYYRLDGSQAITADFQAGGYKLTNVGAASNNSDVPRWDQVVPKTGGDFTGHVNVGGNLYSHGTLGISSNNAPTLQSSALYHSADDAVRFAITPVSGTAFNLWGYEVSSDKFQINKNPITIAGYTPTLDNELAPKDYVDDTISDYVDAEYLYIGSTYYGLLIETNISSSSNFMFTLNIRGNGYTTEEVIFTTIEGYWHASQNKFINLHGIQLGTKFDVDAIIYNGKIAFWLHGTSSGGSNSTFFVKLYESRYYRREGVTLTNTTKPSSGITVDNTIRPERYSPTYISARYYPQHPDGCLITTDISTTLDCMFRLEIRGNSYTGDHNIHCDIEGYWYNQSQSFYNLHGVQIGLEFDVVVMVQDDVIKFWFDNTGYTFPSVNARVIDTKTGKDLYSIVTNEVKPTSNVSNETTIVPERYTRIVKTTADIDTLTTPGIYAVNTTYSNYPGTRTNGTLVVTEINGLINQHWSAVDECYVRRYQSGSWTNWMAIIKSDTVRESGSSKIINIVQMTQSAYNNLSTKHSDTLYIIT